jgi:hypothetical protein
VQDKRNFAVFDYDTWRATRSIDFVLHVDGPKPVGQRGLATIWGPPVKRRYVLKPGEQASIPRIYRDAIRRVVDDVVVGGMCPQGLELLTPNGEVVPVKIAPAIDPSRPPPSTGGAPAAGAEGRLRARLKGATS